MKTTIIWLLPLWALSLSANSAPVVTSHFVDETADPNGRNSFHSHAAGRRPKSYAAKVSHKGDAIGPAPASRTIMIGGSLSLTQIAPRNRSLGRGAPLSVDIQSVSGTDDAELGIVPYNSVHVGNDSASLGGGPNSTGTAFLVRQEFGGPSARGQRAAISGQLSLSGSTSNDGSLTGNYPTYAALVGNALAKSSDNGTDTTSTTSSGEIVGANLIGELSHGAKNYYAVKGAELNVAIQSGASSYRKEGLQIAEFARDALQGSGDDAALAIANQPGAIGWRNAILVGNAEGGGLNANGTILASGFPGQQAINGIDLTGFRFSGSAILFAGGSISPTGAAYFSELHILEPGAIPLSRSERSQPSDNIFWETRRGTYWRIGPGIEDPSGFQLSNSLLAGPVLDIRSSGTTHFTYPVDAGAGLVIPSGTPHSSAEQCVAGQIEFDDLYLYTCVRPNTWHRVLNGSSW